MTSIAGIAIALALFSGIVDSFVERQTGIGVCHQIFGPNIHRCSREAKTVSGSDGVGIFEDASDSKIGSQHFGTILGRDRQLLYREAIRPIAVKLVGGESWNFGFLGESPDTHPPKEHRFSLGQYMNGLWRIVGHFSNSRKFIHIEHRPPSQKGRIVRVVSYLHKNQGGFVEYGVRFEEPFLGNLRLLKRGASDFHNKARTKSGLILQKRDLVGPDHGFSGVASLFDGLESQFDLAPNQKGANARYRERQERCDSHPNRGVSHNLLCNQVPQFVWVGLIALGLVICYCGFGLSGWLFERERHRAFWFAALLIPAGGLLFGMAVIAFLAK